MALTNTDVLALQLEAVVPLVDKFYEVEDALCAKFAKVTVQDQSSRDLRIPIPMRPGGKFRAANFDGGDWGRGSGPNYQVGTMTPVDTVIAVEWTKKTEFVTDNRTKAVASAVQKLVADAMVEFKVYHDKLLQTAGNAKLAALADSGSTSGEYTTYTLAAPFGAQLLRIGQVVQIWSSSSTYTYRGACSIQNIDYPNGTVTFYKNATSVTSDKLPSGVTSGDLLLVENATTSPAGTSGIVSLPSFVYGLPYHHNNAATGTWLTLNRANFPELVTPSVDAGSGALTTTQPQVLLAKIEMALGQNALDGAKLFWYMHPKQHIAYVQLAQLISEVSLGSNGNNGAVDVLHSRKDMRRMCGIEIMPSINADPTRIDLIDANNWIRGTYLDTQIMTMAGMTKLPIYGSSGGFGGAEIFYIGQSSNFASKNPRKGGYIYSLATPSFA